jgi:hypothetical protein
MQTDDFEKFCELLAALGERFDKKLTPMTLKLDFAAFSRFTIEQIEAAVMTWYTTGKFFPRPVELIELIEGKADSRGEKAWEKFVDAIRKGGQMKSVYCDDPKLLRSVQLLYGSWIKACEELPPITNPMHANHRTQFLAVYTNCTDGIQYLKGLREAAGMAPAQAFGKLGSNEVFIQSIVHIGETVTVREMEFSAVTGALTEQSIQQLQAPSYLRLLAA